MTPRSDADTTVEIEPSSPQFKTTPPTSQVPWKLILLVIFTASTIIIVNVCPQVKDFLYNFGVAIMDLGWIGPLLFILFNGLIIIPFAIPYMIFEMTIALLIKNFFYASCLSFAGKVVGSTVSYFVAKYLFQNKIRGSFKNFEIYKGIEYVMERNPIKFSIILRIISIPLFLKNYGLALPESVNFKLYSVCNVIATIPTTFLNIYLLRSAGDVRGFFDGSQTKPQLAVSIIFIIISVGFFAYIVWYTRKVIKELRTLNQSTGAKLLEAKTVEDTTSPMGTKGIGMIELSSQPIQEQSLNFSL